MSELRAGATYAPRNRLWNFWCLLLITSPALCAHTPFFCESFKKIPYSVHCVFPERQQSLCQNLWFQSGAPYISIEKRKIKGRPATPVDEFEMYCYDKPEPAPALGDEFCWSLEERQIYQAFWSLLLMVSGGCVSYLLSWKPRCTVCLSEVGKHTAAIWRAACWGKRTE